MADFLPPRLPGGRLRLTKSKISFSKRISFRIYLSNSRWSVDQLNLIDSMIDQYLSDYLHLYLNLHCRFSFFSLLNRLYLWNCSNHVLVRVFVGVSTVDDGRRRASAMKPKPWLRYSSMVWADRMEDSMEFEMSVDYRWFLLWHEMDTDLIGHVYR